MRGWRALAVAGLLIIPASARARSYVQDDLSLSSTRATETNPQSGAVTDNLSGSWQASEPLALGAHLALTHDKATPSAGAFANTGGNIVQLGLSADWDATAHLSLGASGDLSPRARQFSDTALVMDVAGTQMPVDSSLRTDASSLGGTLSLTYDTADLDADVPANLDFAFGLNLGATRFSSAQQIVGLSFTGPTGKQRDLSVTTLRDSYCPKHPKAPICKVVAGLNGQSASVTQFPLEADITATVQQDTDVGLAFTYFVYSEDPTTVGFFTVARVGRSAQNSLSFGSGVPLAPQQWAVRPDVDHVFGPVTVDLFGAYGQYLDDQGHEASVGLKLKWRVDANWRLTAGLTLTRETPGPGLTGNLEPGSDAAAPTNSSLFAAGVRYSF